MASGGAPGASSIATWTASKAPKIIRTRILHNIFNFNFFVCLLIVLFKPTVK